MKKCSKCKENKQLKEFDRQTSKKDGRQGYCRLCAKELRTTKYREIYLQKGREYYINHKEDMIKYINHRNSTVDNGLAKRYQGIVARCRYPSQESYKNYGGRGIKNEWVTYRDFKNDMYESYLSHLEKYGRKQTSIDRIDVDGNYCRENCRWVTCKEQCANKRIHKVIHK